MAIAAAGALHPAFAARAASVAASRSALYNAIGRNATELVVGQASNSLSYPITRRGAYILNDGFPNLIPELQDIIRLYVTGRIGRRTFEEYGLKNGANITGRLGGQKDMDLWSAVTDMAAFTPSVDEVLNLSFRGIIDDEYRDTLLRKSGLNNTIPSLGRLYNTYISLRNPIPLDLALSLWRLGQIGDNEIRELIKLSGWKNVADQDKFLSDTFSMTEYQAVQQWLMGTITPEVRDKYLKFNGITSNESRNSVLLASTPLTVDEYIASYFRGNMTWQLLQERMAANGIMLQDDRDRSLELRRPIPPPSDLIRFAMKEVWDDDIVRAFGYDEEFSPAFQYWMEKQGYRGAEPAFQAGGRQYPAISWPLAYHRAGWQMISPTQSYEMLHRLRPNRVGLWANTIPNLRPFTIDDVKLVLKTADYPSPLRERLAAISYQVLGRVDIRRMQETRIIDRAEAIELYQDRGYQQADAVKLADYTPNKINYDRLKRVAKDALKRAKSAYMLGALPVGEYALALYLADPPADVNLADALTRDRERNIGNAMNDPVIKYQIEQTDFDINEREGKAAIGAIRASYLRWYTDDNTAAELLRRAGILEQRIPSIIRRWYLQRIAKGKMASAANLLGWYQRGLIDSLEAERRLLAMGYGAIDVARMLAQSNQSLATAAAKAMEAAAKNRQQQINAAANLAKKLQAEADAAKKKLAQLGTPAKLGAWFKKGLITESIYRQRLADAGIRLDDINTAVTENKP